MLEVKFGDSLPIVAACQVLLNAYRTGSAPIAVDGIFKTHTQAAVREYQEQQGLTVTGVVDLATWTRLAAENQLRVHDHVDIFDPMLHESETFLRRAGGQPSLAGGMCNGIAALRGELMSHGVTEGRLVLLRFHGHGNKGVQAVSYGTSVHTLYDAIRGEPVPDLHHVPSKDSFPRAQMLSMTVETMFSQVSNLSLQLPQVMSSLMTLSPLFHPLASVEFHGCQVGRGQSGRQMLRKVADLLRVPAVGAKVKQFTGNAVHYKGAVEVQCPRGKSLVQWAKGLPEIRESN